MKRVFFKPVSRFNAIANKVFKQEKSKIIDKLPFAEVHHIGGTAIPKSLTKGDLDINVRVSKDNFKVANRALKQMYKVHQANNWTDNFASFKGEGFPIELGVQLTVSGSPDDIFVSNRDYLLRHPEKVEELNVLKAKYESKSMSSYRKAKEAFFRKLYKN